VVIHNNDNKHGESDGMKDTERSKTQKRKKKRKKRRIQIQAYEYKHKRKQILKKKRIEKRTSMQKSDSLVGDSAVSEYEWKIAGQNMCVLREYPYLGLEMGRVLPRLKWNTLVCRYISEAKRACAILYRGGCHKMGLRARSCMQLFKAKVAPVLEYGTELWTADDKQMDKLRKVQHVYGHTILGANNYTSNVFVESELGMMNISTRKDELTLRWWWRLQQQIQMSVHRAVSSVARHKWQQVQLLHGDIAAPADLDPTGGSGSNKGQHSDLNKMRELLLRYGFVQEWNHGINIVEVKQEEWKTKVQKAVRTQELQSRQRTIAAQPSLMDSGYAQCVQAKTGDYKVASYLDDVYNREAMYKRMELRAGSLRLLATVGRHARPQWAPNKCYCKLCDMQEKEDTKHFLVRCPFFNEHRKRLLEELAGRLEVDSDSAVQLYGRVVMDRIRRLPAEELRLIMLDGVNSLDVQYPRSGSDVVKSGRTSKQDQKERTLAVQSVHNKVERTISNYVWICWKARERHLRTADEQIK
jgi:hypothetical protein